MSVLFVLLPVAMVIVAVAIGAFLWAARRGQFDDLTTPALRALDDDEPHGRRPAARPWRTDKPADERPDWQAKRKPRVDDTNP